MITVSAVSTHPPVEKIRTPGHPAMAGTIRSAGAFFRKRGENPPAGVAARASKPYPRTQWAHLTNLGDAASAANDRLR
jgi:hypothetical protein